MDRLPALIITGAAVALVACDSGKSDRPVAGRTDTTKVATKSVSAAEFCDVSFPGTSGPLFNAPALTGGTLAASSTRWRWVNVWATWCKPCVEELPRLVKWRDKLGASYDLELISVDDNDADVAAFRAESPTMPPSPRLADVAKQGEWIASLGLDAAAPVPIHIFVEPQGHVRCARAGGVREHDFAAVQALFAK
jgi:thiol-disulfide isomerase/thioredoxin